MALDYRNIRSRRDYLEGRGVNIGRPYVMNDLKNRLSRVLAADSELAVAELLGHKTQAWKALTLQPHPARNEDVDVRLLKQGWQFNAQVKTFDLLSSKYGRRIAQHTSGWDDGFAPNQNGYVARVIRGDGDVVLEDIRQVEGVARLARAGVLMFEPSSDDRRQMESTVLSRLKEATNQLAPAEPVRIVVFDVRRSHVDSYTLYHSVNGYLRRLPDPPEIEGVAMLTYLYEGSGIPDSTLAVIWARPGYERSLYLFRPPKPVYLVQARPFAMPTHLYHERPGWNDFLSLDKGFIKIDGVTYGPAFF